MRCRPLWTVALLLGALAGGCGSKISEANYYRVQHGMTEEDVEDLLGPAAQDDLSASAAVTRPAGRRVKTWTRGRLTIRVAFENGVVVNRSADGIAFEKDPSPATSRATSPAST
jgi:hypothetical protein